MRAEGTATTLRRCVVLSSAPRDARWPIATHHPVFPSHITHISRAQFLRVRVVRRALRVALLFALVYIYIDI